MRLTISGYYETNVRRSVCSSVRPFVAAIVMLLLCACAWLDYVTGAAPVQHLYYLPIILAASEFDYTGGLACALSAIVLYHLANQHLLALHYGESDYLQIALFFTVGVVTAKLAGDRRAMRRLARTDDLTGLHNLRSFESQLRMILSAAQVRRTAVSMMVLDLDRLKVINDVHGHLAGAEAVRAVGHLIARCFDKSAVACRYGGDEFALLIPDCDACAAAEAAERLRDAVENYAPVLVGRQFPAGTLTVSIGVVGYLPSVMRDAEVIGEELFHAADLALYDAKREGRNRVCLKDYAAWQCEAEVLDAASGASSLS